MNTLAELGERYYWSQMAYGKAITIRRAWVLGTFILLCMVTPATNWMIPIFSRKVKGITIRYGG